MVVVGLTILTGGAEAIIDGLVGVVVYALWQLVSQGRRGVGRRDDRRFGRRWVAGGVAGGVALGTAQWLPGLVFTSQSQRAATSYRVLHHGVTRLPPARPFGVPVRARHQPEPAGSLRGQYNFPEVTSYMGILALIAVTTLWSPPLPAATRGPGLAGLVRGRGRRAPVRPGRGDTVRPDPLPRTLVRDERLLNRNLLLVDFAFAVLLGWWLHALFDRARHLDPAPTGAARSADEPPPPPAVGSGHRMGTRTASRDPAHRARRPPSSWSWPWPPGRTAGSSSNSSMPRTGLPMSARLGVAGHRDRRRRRGRLGHVIVLREGHLEPRRPPSLGSAAGAGRRSPAVHRVRPAGAHHRDGRAGRRRRRPPPWPAPPPGALHHLRPRPVRALPAARASARPTSTSFRSTAERPGLHGARPTPTTTGPPAPTTRRTSTRPRCAARCGTTWTPPRCCRCRATS